jgi:DNA-directed RNA polymerase specialized sigma24 family protein
MSRYAPRRRPGRDEDDGGAGGAAPAAPPEGSLAWLAARRDRSGAPLLDPVERAAGERLAADVEKAGRGGRVTMDWDGFGPRSASRAGTSDGRFLAADAALSARRAVEAALAGLEPDFAALAMAVCCEGIGLAEAERRFGWPARSGRLMLRYALRALARHYGLSGLGPSRGSGLRAWGTVDYRPRA